MPRSLPSPAPDSAPVERRRAAARGSLPVPGLREWAALLTLVVVWGSAFLLTDVALAGYTPATLVAGRLFIGAGLLLLVVMASGQRLPRSRRQWGVILVMALMGNVFPFSLIAWGQQTVPSGMAGILMAVMPLVVLVLAHRFAGDRITAGRAVGLLVGFAGVVVLLGPTVAGSSVGSTAGQLAILGAAVCYGINVMLARLLGGTPAVVAAASVMLMANVFVLPAAVVGDVSSMPTMSATLALLALGVFSTALGSLIYFRLVVNAGPVFLSLINYLIPVYAVLAGALFLGERLPEQALIGLALVLSGIFISQYRRQSDPPPEMSRTRERIRPASARPLHETGGTHG
jgi:drug/metabolite transporter (DMT)-like permease